MTKQLARRVDSLNSLLNEALQPNDAWRQLAREILTSASDARGSTSSPLAGSLRTMNSIIPVEDLEPDATARPDKDTLLADWRRIVQPQRKEGPHYKPDIDWTESQRYEAQSLPGPSPARQTYYHAVKKLLKQREVKHEK